MTFPFSWGPLGLLFIRLSKFGFLGFSSTGLLLLALEHPDPLSLELHHFFYVPPELRNPGHVFASPLTSPTPDGCSAAHSPFLAQALAMACRNTSCVVNCLLSCKQPGRAQTVLCLCHAICAMPAPRSQWDTKILPINSKFLKQKKRKRKKQPPKASGCYQTTASTSQSISSSLGEPCGSPCSPCTSKTSSACLLAASFQ